MPLMMVGSSLNQGWVVLSGSERRGELSGDLKEGVSLHCAMYSPALKCLRVKQRLFPSGERCSSHRQHGRFVLFLWLL